MDRELRRTRWVINRKLKGWTSTEIATVLRIDERTVYRWWRIFRKHGWEGLHIKSHRPHTTHQTPQSTAERGEDKRNSIAQSQERSCANLRPISVFSTPTYSSLHRNTRPNRATRQTRSRKRCQLSSANRNRSMCRGSFLRRS